jgi:hypothetical protein
VYDYVTFVDCCVTFSTTSDLLGGLSAIRNRYANRCPIVTRLTHLPAYSVVQYDTRLEMFINTVESGYTVDSRIQC